MTIPFAQNTDMCRVKKVNRLIY